MFVQRWPNICSTLAKIRCTLCTTFAEYWHILPIFAQHVCPILSAARHPAQATARAYRRGWSAADLFSQLNDADFIQSGGLVPVTMPAAAGGSSSDRDGDGKVRNRPYGAIARLAWKFLARRATLWPLQGEDLGVRGCPPCLRASLTGRATLETAM
eukprot:366210-Chlamydomonas_euryale.AAC.5